MDMEIIQIVLLAFAVGLASADYFLRRVLLSLGIALIAIALMVPPVSALA
jgi:hypothetical protein